ncbi:MAG: hypothetical protein R3B09_04820 [Nannocystaceae bacterium]
MKVLFVGDGAHDVGKPETRFHEVPWIALGGVVPHLARKVVPGIREDSLALTWGDLARLSAVQGSGRVKDYARKVGFAVTIAARRYGCDAVVAVVDRDGEKSRLVEAEAIAKAIYEVPTVYGVAIESIEAWTLGSRTALAVHVGVGLPALHGHYPHSRVEEFYATSGKAELRSKEILARVAGLCHQRDSLAFREAVAQATDVAELERACPRGFGPFAAALRGLSVVRA